MHVNTFVLRIIMGDGDIGKSWELFTPARWFGWYTLQSSYKFILNNQDKNSYSDKIHIHRLNKNGKEVPNQKLEESYTICGTWFFTFYSSFFESVISEPFS